MFVATKIFSKFVAEEFVAMYASFREWRRKMRFDFDCGSRILRAMHGVDVSRFLRGTPSISSFIRTPHLAFVHSGRDL